MEQDLKARVLRLEMMFENVKDGKPFWIPYGKEPIKEPPEEPSEKVVSKKE